MGSTARSTNCELCGKPAAITPDPAGFSDFIEAGEARFDNGLLSIQLKRVVPEAMKPRKIEIGGRPPANDRIEAPSDENRQAA